MTAWKSTNYLKKGSILAKLITAFNKYVNYFWINWYTFGQYLEHWPVLLKIKHIFNKQKLLIFN